MIGPILQTLIGSSIDLYPGRATQAAKAPFVVYAITSLEPSPTKQAATGIDTYLVRVNVYDEVLADAEDIADAIRLILDNYRGTVGTETVDGIRMQNESTDYDDGSMYYVKQLDYKIRIKI